MTAVLERADLEQFLEIAGTSKETTQASGSSGYAQAKVHDAVRKDIREASAMQVASDITRDLITPLIALNFSDVVVPRFEFITQDPIDLKAFAEALKNLKDAGMRIPETWALEQAGADQHALA